MAGGEAVVVTDCSNCGSPINPEACAAYVRETYPDDTTETIDWFWCVACLMKNRKALSTPRQLRDSANGPWGQDD